MEMHVSIERIMLDQNKGYPELASTAAAHGSKSCIGRAPPPIHIVSMRSRWVGKSGRIRREGMGKRVNFCARSVVTCDSYIDADEIMVPHAVANRLTYPVLVHAYNLADLTRRMRSGAVLFVQRAGQPRLRAIGHIAILALALDPRDRLIRRNGKYPLLRPPLPSVEDVPLPVQGHVDGVETVLCYGDRIFSLHGGRVVVDPLQHVTWPVLEPGDTVLVTPQDGDWVLMNRQPTLVQESMLGMRMRVGPNLRFGATCGPIEALRGDYDFVSPCCVKEKPHV